MKTSVALFALGLLAVSHAVVADTITTSDSDIRGMLKTRVDVQKRATGIVVGLIDAKGKRIVAYGTMGVDDSRPVDGETVFDIGSITKVFTALLLSEMAQRDEVALDDPVARYRPRELRLPARHGRQITLADLATHTSGLPLRPSNLVSKNPDNPYAGYSSALLDEFVSSFVPARDAGSHYEYSNAGYALLGQALSQRAGESYSGLVHDRLTEPLGMRSTRIDPDEEMKRRWATGYSNELTPVSHWDFGALAAAGGLRSSANDLLKLLTLFVGENKSALASAAQAMLKTRRLGGMSPSTDISLAWNIFVDGGCEVVWKNGSVGGYRSFLGFDPKAQVGVVALANAQTAVGADDIGLHLLDPRLPVDLSTPKKHQEIALAPAVLDRYAGSYRFSPNDVVVVTREGDHLFVPAPGSGKLELFAESEHDFFLKALDVQITFESSGDQPATAALWHQGGQTERGARIK